MSFKRVLGCKVNYNPRSVRMSLEKATERYKNGNSWNPEIQKPKIKEKANVKNPYKV